MIRNSQIQPDALVARSRPWLPAVLVVAPLVAVIALVAWPSNRPDAASVPLAPGIPGDVGIEPKLDEQVPLGVKFHNEAGESIELAELIDGKPVILNLMYFRCPMLCNMVMDGLMRAMRTMQFTPGEEFTVLTVSFDPSETPEMAAAAKQTAIERYGRAKAARGWHFLTGDEESIRRLTDAVGFRFAYDDDRGEYAHGAGVFVLTPTGKVSRFFSGIQFGARDLRLGLVEASENKIGTVGDHVLLLCYQYDPSQGKYGLVIMNIIRFAGGTTVLAMIAGFILMSRRGRLRVEG